jgi:diguanylate cyclase (GGDEF)-like protein
MPAKAKPIFLLASHEPAFLSSVEPILIAQGVQVRVVLSGEMALASMLGHAAPNLVMLDVNLPGMPVAQLLAAAQASPGARQCPIVLISDTVTEEWLDRLAEGVIEDIIPSTTASPFWRVRLDSVLRTFRLARELEQMTEGAAMNAQFDRLTGVLNRDTLMGALFRETDRAQRMRNSLCMVLFDVDDFSHWNGRLGEDACNELLGQIAGCSTRLLRSYDLMGRMGADEFLVAMPGCSSMNAVVLAERLRQDVFCAPFQLAGETVRLSACFGISASNGRSPLVVLREAEQALKWAKDAGPESILCYSEQPMENAPPVTYFTPSTGDELIAW